MSRQSTHLHSLVNSIPQTHQLNLTAPIKPENDSDEDDLVFLGTAPKVPHTPEDYDPECQCSTCQMVRRLLAECTCEECRGQQTNQVNQGQVAQSSENVPIVNAVSPTNVQPSSSSIQNNDASTSEHTNANDLVGDDRESRSSTPDYVPRFFADESGDSDSDSESSVDSGVDQDDMELDQESDNDDDDDGNRNNPKYVFDDYEKDNSVYDGDDQELDQQSENDDNDDGDDDDPDYSYTKSSTNKSPRGSHSKSSTKHLRKHKRYKCPSCNQSFAKSTNMIRHCRVIHQQLKPYYCKWSKCDFVSGRTDSMIEHITGKHFKNRNKNTERAKIYIGKRESSLPEVPLPPNDFTNPDFDETSHVDCPRCRRNVHSRQLKSHLSTHKNPGFRCTWPNCGFFFSRLTEAKKHVCADHFQGKVDTSNTTQINKHLLKVYPNTGKTRKVHVRQSRSLNSPDHHFEPSTSGYHLVSERRHEATDDESSSSEIEYNIKDNFYSDKSTVKSNTTQQTSFDCPKCGASFDSKGRLLRHYRSVHQKWKPYYCRWPKCDFVAPVYDIVVGHANRKHFKDQNRQKARKCVGKRDETPPRDHVLEQIYALYGTDPIKSVCPRCGRNLPIGFFEAHLRTHKNTGFRCIWPKCGFFYSLLHEAKKHVCADHLHTEKANSTVTNRYLLKVNPITGKTTKVMSIQRRNGEEDNLDTSMNEENSDSDDNDVEESNLNSTDHHSQPSTSGNHLANESNLSEIESNDEKEVNFDKPTQLNTKQSSFDCPKCAKSFNSKCQLVRHYRGIHREWKPYYCRWPKCHFVAGILDNVVRHADLKHFNYQNRDKARKCVGKLEGTPPRDHVLERIIAGKYDEAKKLTGNKTGKTTTKVVSYQRRETEEFNPDNAGYDRNTKLNNIDESSLKSNTFNLNCPKCNRNFLTKGQFGQHFRSHSKSGFRCTWSNCGAFYSQYQFAKKHLLTQHFKGKLVNETQVTKHLVKVDPSLSSRSEIANADGEYDLNS